MRPRHINEAARAKLPWRHRARLRWFPPEHHPLTQYEAAVRAAVTPDAAVLDLGCGHTPVILNSLRGTCRHLIGLDPTVTHAGSGVALLRSVADNIPLASGSIDLCLSRAVLEHLDDPAAVFREVARVLKPGGRWLCITPNFWDYVSLIAWVLPNRWHPYVVGAIEGRPHADTFPTRYRANTHRAIRTLAADAGLRVARLTYDAQDPHYLNFHILPFLVGAAYAQATMRIPGLAPLRSWIVAELHRDPRGAI